MILIRQIDGLPAEQARIWCSKRQSPCQGRMQIKAERRAVTLFIKASSIPGNIYLKFVTEDHDLSVGSKPYLHLGVGDTGKLHQTVAVSVASEHSATDNPTALTHRPVLREPDEFVAVLRVDIDLDR